MLFVALCNLLIVCQIIFIIVCPPGNFGTRCQSQCGHCNNGTCHHITGKCTSSCAPGWYGEMCQNSKFFFIILSSMNPNSFFSFLSYTVKLKNIVNLWLRGIIYVSSNIIIDDFLPSLSTYISFVHTNSLYLNSIFKNTYYRIA